MTIAEENYLKSIYHISESKKTLEVGTNELASHLGLKPATVNSMLKRLKEKKLLEYEKYGKISLTEQGNEKALYLIRKHRIWETFLHNVLGFTWDEVHEVAEELEHINSDKLISSLDKFLNYPKYDPHGEAIPNQNGKIVNLKKKTLSDFQCGKICKMVAVTDDSSVFLKYVESVGLGLNKSLKKISTNPYDSLTIIEVNGKQFTVSQKFAENILVE